MQQFERRTWLCAGSLSVRQKESCKITKKFAEAGEKAESKPENNYERIEREIPAAANRRKFCKNSGEAQKAQKSSRILRNSETASGLGKWHSACQKESPRAQGQRRPPRRLAGASLFQADRGQRLHGSWRLPMPIQLASVAPERTVPSGAREPSRGTTIRSGAPESARKLTQRLRMSSNRRLLLALKGGENVSNIWVGR